MPIEAEVESEAELEEALAAGADSPQRIRERFAKLASATGIPVETHCHNDLGMAVANSVSGALGDLDAGQDAWINTCINGIGERSGNADLLSCILAFQHGFGVTGRAEIGDPVDLSWARRFALWASYAFGQPLPLRDLTPPVPNWSTPPTSMRSQSSTSGSTSSSPQVTSPAPATSSSATSPPAPVTSPQGRRW